MMVAWPIVKAEMHRNPPRPRAKRGRWTNESRWFGDDEVVPEEWDEYLRTTTGPPGAFYRKRVERGRSIWFRLGFWTGFLIGGLFIAAMILAWRLFLPLWTLGV